jgi:multidrug efflux pump
MLDKIKEFKPSSWSIDNKTSVYLITLFVLITGVVAYQNLAKEQFPEVVFPQIMVNTIYPGTSPENMESLVSKEIEKECKGITGVKKITSNSVENFSSVMIEFSTTEDVEKAKQRVKDAVDKASIPNDLPAKPTVIAIDISQVPIMNVHLSGNIDLDRLKKYADILQDRIEGLKEISRVDVVGALDREIQVNVDLFKMEANNITMRDLESAIAFENMTVSGGTIDMGNVKRNITVAGQFKDPRQIGNIVVRGGSGAIVRVSDIAEIRDAHKEKESYARLERKNVITLNVIKKGGENLITSSRAIEKMAEEMTANELPKDVTIKITGAQVEQTEVGLHDLINTIIIGFILVTLILLFFMGTTNAIFVAMSVPISMCVAFLVEPAIFTGILGYKTFSLNFMVLFSFLIALGIVVDDAIVVIENTHRIFANGKVPIIKAAKLAAGEVFLPVFSGTLTTLAPFFPLLFWQGVIGKFMFYLPMTMIITLFASLVVAYIINPVFAVDFMKPHTEGESHRKITKGFIRTSISFITVIIISYITYLTGAKTVKILWGLIEVNTFGWANLVLTMFGLYLLNKFVLMNAADAFQKKYWPRVQNAYAGMMNRFLKTTGRAWAVLGVTILVLFGSIAFFTARSPDVVFFPASDPNFVYTYIKLPVGTSAEYTDKITQEVENRVFRVLGDNNPLVSSVISNVAVGATDPQSFDLGTNSNLGKVTVAFVKFAQRDGKATKPYLNKIRDAVKGLPGVEVSVAQESNGPPTGKDISIEIAGEDFKELSKVATDIKKFLDDAQIAGVEELKSDLILNKPELLVEVDRARANREGISTAQIGGELRGAIFGKEASKFKTASEDFPINIRAKEGQRQNIGDVLNSKLIYRDMNMGGQLRQVPMSSIANVKYGTTYGGIKRKNQKRLVTLNSGVITGFNPNNVVAQVQAKLLDFKAPETVTVKFGGQQEEQAETMGFLGFALAASVGLIMLILVIQFNSISKMLIILSEIFLSIIGVLLGFAIFKMEISIVMTGVGVIALAGIVVRNGILLVEFTEILLKDGMPLKEAIVEAGRTRMTPVLLTASATILGLVPLAVGLNMDFVKLFTELNPHLYFGGDNVAFFGPLSWTIIFGLAFATLLTLILVPAMLLIAERMKISLFKNYDPNKDARKHFHVEEPENTEGGINLNKAS